jgi:hypothetical protein
MKETIAIARHILDEHHKYYTKNGIDDAEMAHELKFILEGVKNYLIEKKAPKKEIKAMLDGLLPTPDGGSIKMRTIWIIDKGHERPRFVTAYPA